MCAARTGLDYLDLYLIHNLMNDVFGAWRALSELLRDGAVRAIGASNFSRAWLEDFISFSEVVPQVNQAEINVLHQQIEDVEYIAEHGIAAQAWAPFARDRNDIFRNKRLQQIADAHGKSVPQVIERWLIQRGIALIPKSTTPERIEQSANIWDFSLSDGEMEAVRALNTATSQFFDWSDPAVFRRLAHLPYED